MQSKHNKYLNLLFCALGGLQQVRFSMYTDGLCGNAPRALFWGAYKCDHEQRLLIELLHKALAIHFLWLFLPGILPQMFVNMFYGDSDFPGPRRVHYKLF